MSDHPVLTTGIPHSPSLLFLNENVLECILDELESKYQIRYISLTCKRIREICMPILFQSCTVSITTILDTTRFLPAAIWPYVRILTFRGRFVREKDGTFETYATTGAFLTDAFRRMIRLRSLEFKLTSKEEPGSKPLFISSVLAAALTAPHVLQISISGDAYERRQIPTELDIAPLTHFSYHQSMYRRNPRATRSQYDLLVLILEKTHATLEEFHCISESLSLRVLYGHDWPQLRVLYLYGQRFTPHNRPYVSILSRMRRLRELRLELANPAHVDRQAIWPPGFNFTYPWPELERLTLTQPHPDDQLFAHLPRSMRRLDIRCWPHYSSIPKDGEHDWKAALGIRWHMPLLMTSEMLGILRRCATPELEHLQLEFRADTKCLDVLRYVTVAFSRLKVLQVHWYREDGVLDDPPIGAIGDILATLKDLRVLRLHLDWPPKHPETLPFRTTVRYFQRDGHVKKLKLLMLSNFNTAAFHLAQVLSPSVEVVSFLQVNRSLWCGFGIERMPNGKTKVTELFTDDIEASYGLTMNDQPLSDDVFS